MRYLHKYTDAEEFQNDYHDHDVRYIVVCGTTFYFTRFWEGEYYWGSDYNGTYFFYNNNAKTDVRNPGVGDDVSFYIGGGSWEDGIIEEIDDVQPIYDEPWVSLAPGTNVHKFLLSCNCEHDEWVYGATFFKEMDGLYAWSSYAYRGNIGTPEIAIYYTTSRNPQVGDSVYASVSGAANDYSIGCVEEILEMDTEVMYNKTGNWIRVHYKEGSSDNYVVIGECGPTFDNSENSTYYVVNDWTVEKTVYKGVRLYWDHFDSLWVNEIPCYRYYFINEDGDGGWMIDEGHQDC